MHDSLDMQRLFSLEGKVAVVTGGSRGIGYMISQGLLQAGARVYITARKAPECEQAAQKLSQYGKCIALPADVADGSGRDQFCAQLRELEDHLNILVNNAGTGWGGDYETYAESWFEKTLRLNVTSVFCLTRDLTPMLVAGASGDDPARVINIGSMDGLYIPTASGGTYAYTASKAAVHHLTRHLAVELGPRGITVNAVAPGIYPTKMTDKLIELRLEILKQNSLLKRLGKAEEMAGVAIYLCSRAGAYTHGTVIPVDGGVSINHQHAKIGEA